MSMLIPLAMRREPNNIMHPSRYNGISSTKSCFGRVMISVRQTKQPVARAYLLGYTEA
jgi:hypothetical protein